MEGNPVIRSVFTDVVMDDHTLLHGSKTGVEAHSGAHVCLADSWTVEGKFSVVTDTTGESLVSGGDGDDATQLRPRSIVLSTRMKYLGKDETCSHVSLPKGFMAVGCKGVFCEKDGEQDCARK